MIFEQDTPYNERSYYGFMNKEVKYLKPLLYFQNEEFSHHPYLPLVVGNFGTIINEAYFGFKMIPSIGAFDHPEVKYTIMENGTAKRVRSKVNVLVLETFYPGFSTKTHKAMFIDGNPQNIVYAPGKPWNNIVPMTTREFMAWRSRNDLRKGNSNIIASDLSDDTVRMICELMQDGYDNEYIVNKLGMANEEGIFRILHGIRSGNKRSDISSHYNIPKRQLQSFTDDDYDLVCSLVASGLPKAKVLEEFERLSDKDISRMYYSILYGEVKAAIPYLKKYNLLKEEK